jgi:anhydro-N-acetylmuramic acid kinase
MKNNFNVIGLMSGTSLDGLDIALCEFHKNRNKWDFSIRNSATVKYPSALSKKLAEAHQTTSENLMALDSELGKFFGKACLKFMETNSIKPDFIASHGHTILHRPDRGFTTQIGNGNAIHSVTGLPVVYDFRSLDVMLGGQGAPLVPIGDRLLFSEHDTCLNLGGIANLSSEVKSERHAFDICFCNMGLNYLMNSLGREFDRNGEKSSTGEVDSKLLGKLRQLYRPLKKKRPSLGRELFESAFQPLLARERISIENKLATFTESIAIEIVDAAVTMKGNSMLCSGGGVFNSFLISRILQHAGDSLTIIIPDKEIIKFKEALIFAFLGVLSVRGEHNALASVTGATRDSSGGVKIGF